jgi:hypothetical protein
MDASPWFLACFEFLAVPFPPTPTAIVHSTVRDDITFQHKSSFFKDQMPSKLMITLAWGNREYTQ